VWKATSIETLLDKTELLPKWNQNNGKTVGFLFREMLHKTRSACEGELNEQTKERQESDRRSRQRIAKERAEDRGYDNRGTFKDVG
jgi:hypothetical protein